MWMVLQHVAWEGPGLVADALEARRLPSRIVRLDQCAAVPADLEGVDGLVVMGGTMGVYEAAQFPFLAREIELLAAAVAGDLPVLGICLGAQLLAASLGAEVVRGP
ncbi:MAG: type 1 glutamine amidotransferase, partial [Terriglobales bacterium]